jgi:GTP-binding protein
MQDVAVYTAPIDAGQRARQPGAEVRRPRAPAGDRGRPGDIVLINGIEGIGIGVTLTDVEARCRCRCSRSTSRR